MTRQISRRGFVKSSFVASAAVPLGLGGKTSSAAEIPPDDGVNGPTGGTLVEHRVCVVSPDWLAADRVAVELMGIDFAKVGYLNYCAQAGLGEGDLRRIEVVGEPIAKHIRRYKLADNIDQQLVWMTPPRKI